MLTLFSLMTEVVAASSSASTVTLDNASCLFLNTSMVALALCGLGVDALPKILGQ